MNNVEIKPYDQLNMQLSHSSGIEFLEYVSDKFADYVPNYYFMPKYQSGSWDGKIRFFHNYNRTLPYGLLFDYIKVHKKYFKTLDNLSVDPFIKDYFTGIDLDNLDFEWDLKFVPYWYQEEAIRTALKYKKGLLRIPTGSGKSIVQAYIFKILLENNYVEKPVIIVPSTTLIQQFYYDLIDYGFSEETLGVYYGKKKELDKTLTISTWQSLINFSYEALQDFDSIFVDEVHTGKAAKVNELLRNMDTQEWRLGCTGTLPSANTDLWSIKGYSGPILRSYSASELEGYISKCTVNMIQVHYKSSYTNFESFDDAKKTIFKDPFRINLIKQLINSKDESFMILVGMVEEEGQYLKDRLEESFTDKEIVFISGKTPVEDRDYWRLECDKRNDLILIATYGVFQQGINIKSLKNIIFAAPFKAEIKILQSIGRSLRQHSSKLKDGSQVYDIIDMTQYFEKQSNTRKKHYDMEGFNILNFEANERNNTFMKSVN